MCGLEISPLPNIVHARPPAMIHEHKSLGASHHNKFRKEINEH
jgi:hypothetical protein